MSRQRRDALLLAVSLLVAGCGGSERETAAVVPAADGARLFAQQCALCHGADGSAETPFAANFKNAKLSDATFAHGGTPAQIAKNIRNGIPGTPMAPFAATLTNEEIDAVAKYVLTLSR